MMFFNNKIVVLQEELNKFKCWLKRNKEIEHKWNKAVCNSSKSKFQIEEILNQYKSETGGDGKFFFLCC